MTYYVKIVAPQNLGISVILRNCWKYVNKHPKDENLIKLVTLARSMQCRASVTRQGEISPSYNIFYAIYLTKSLTVTKQNKLQNNRIAIYVPTCR
jgi:hypothetical protein